MRSVRGTASIGIAALGGVAIALSTPPLGFLPGVFIGLAMLAYALGEGRSLRWAFLIGVVWASVAGVIGLRFVVEAVQRFTGADIVLGVVVLVLLALAQSLAFGVGAMLACALNRHAKVPFALAFGAGVFVASVAPGVFTWTPAALLAARPQLVQLAEYVGEPGVSFVVAVVAALLAATVQQAIARPRAARSIAPPAIAAVLALVGLELFGDARMDAIEGRAGQPMRIALVDPAAPAIRHRTGAQDLAEATRLELLVRRAETGGAQLVVLPEAAYPIPVAADATALPGFYPAIDPPGASAPVLFGLTTFSHTGGAIQRYNAATIESPDGSLERAYDKLKLLWFGETVPFGRSLPFLKGIFAQTTNTTAGTVARGLTMRMADGSSLRIGVLICYEDTSSGVGRRIAGAVHPQLMVNVTNDAWFAGTSASELQARFAVMRAVELRTPLVAAVNEGESEFIDAAGRVQAKSGRPGTLFVTPRVNSAEAGLTLYARLGNWPMWGLLALVAIASFARRGRLRRQRVDRRAQSG